jgi:outer membrane receptor protein involved in Fe transport
VPHPPRGSGASANFDNGQFGVYIQDDWAINPRLELNIGLRWDYESNMLNNDYVTPADRITALRKLDVPRYGITPPPGQTYAQSLARGGVNIDDYISNGSSRKPYKEAFAPRLGASYDLSGNRMTVLYGGWGRSYDRTMANHALDELQKNQQPNGEIWLIRNDFKMPYADQYTIGVRQALREWNAELAFSQVDAKHQFQWFLGNRDANGGYAHQSPIDPLWGGPDGYGSLVLGDFVGESKTSMVLGKLEKPYTTSSGWGVNVAYTYADAKTKHRDWNDDIFDWTYGKPVYRGWNRSILIDEHRLVLAGVMSRWLPWGLQLAGKATWGSGIPRRITNCSAGFDQCVNTEGDAPSFRQVDMGLTWGFPAWGHTFGLRLDVLNVFNTTNYGAFDDWGGGPVPAGAPRNSVGGDNLNLGNPTGIRGDPRTVKVMLSVAF